MFFSEQAVKEIEEIKTRYPDPAAAMLPALYVAQGEHKFIDDQAIAAVAEILGQTEIAVREVATWYTMYHKEPIGTHLIEICTNLSCQLNGGAELLQGLCEQLDIKPGETTADGRFTVHEVECLGSCGTAPAMQIDGEFHENLTLDKVSAILRAAD